jgi:hypothetical protein
VQRFANGDIYEGNFKGGKMCGIGAYKLGEFKGTFHPLVEWRWALLYASCLFKFGFDSDFRDWVIETELGLS